MSKVKDQAEDIIAKFVEETNPIDLKTGEKYTPSEEEFTKAWDKAVQSIIDFKNNQF